MDNNSSLVCVFCDGRFKVAQYTKLDESPDGQGSVVWKFFQDRADIRRLRKGLEYIRILSRDRHQQRKSIDKDLCKVGDIVWDGNIGSVPDRENTTQSEGHYQGDMSTERDEPSLRDDIGAGILELIAQATIDKPVNLFRDLDFANSPDCKWAYVINLDTEMLEVFQGQLPKDWPGTERFQNVGGENNSVPVFIKSFHLINLPRTREEFVGLVNVAAWG
ncbi:uncharacterized protein BP5553_10163 [Venustampulla echinocandica]|uniref:Uncharacterized protein n=1 Tax=Venustampulla echinocandica TaxID=2656787 RepID=A0A370TAH9_9HELO|nr:uncharacterized protein BP5553_10163 [Venustampulla echinocandica]RDL30818.1 hypothetical protein BP5553_10163 [Venustampulla echinocandica]